MRTLLFVLLLLSGIDCVARPASKPSLLTTVKQEIQLDVIEHATREVLRQAQTYADLSDLRIYVMWSPWQAWSTDQWYRLNHRFDDLELSIWAISGWRQFTPWKRSNVDIDIGTISYAGGLQVYVDLYWVIHSVYNRKTAYLMEYTPPRSWKVIREDFAWEDKGYIVLPCTIDGKPCCFTEGPNPELIPCDD